MKKVSLLLVFISLILSCGEKNEKENKKIFVSDFTEESDKSSISLEFVLYDSVTTSQVLIIRDKLEHNAERILDFFKIKPVDTFKVHVWGNYENYLIAQELYAGQRYEGSRGYVISSNELAMFLTDDIEETAEHEFVHAVSLCVDASNPRWLWESVATYGFKPEQDIDGLDFIKLNQFIPRDDLIEQYKRADICVITSLFDNSPNTVYEAMALRKVVVASSVGGIPEIIGSKENGFLFDPKDVNDLVEKLEDAIKLVLSGNSEKIRISAQNRIYSFANLKNNTKQRLSLILN